MTPLERSLLSTLALADAEKQPFLSLHGITEHLHKDAEKKYAPTLSEIAYALEGLIQKEHVVKRDDLYALYGTTEIPTGRSFSEKKMHEARFVLACLSAVPFVRALAVTGSVSLGNAGRESDLDVFVLAKKNHVWTARLFSLALLELLGRRRDAQGREKKICLNYFLVENGKAPVQNSASATMFKRAIPIFGSSVFLNFIRDNAWMSAFLYHPEPEKTLHLQERRPWALSFVQRCTELLLAGFIGSSIEGLARSWQERRLRKKRGGTENTPHFFLSEDTIMLHHPNPKNESVMREYERVLKDIASRTPRRYTTKKHGKGA